MVEESEEMTPGMGSRDAFVEEPAKRKPCQEDEDDVHGPSNPAREEDDDANIAKEK